MNDSTWVKLNDPDTKQRGQKKCFISLTHNKCNVTIGNDNTLNFEDFFTVTHTAFFWRMK